MRWVEFRLVKVIARVLYAHHFLTVSVYRAVTLDFKSRVRTLPGDWSHQLLLGRLYYMKSLNK